MRVGRVLRAVDRRRIRGCAEAMPKCGIGEEKKTGEIEEDIERGDARERRDPDGKKNPEVAEKKSGGLTTPDLVC